MEATVEKIEKNQVVVEVQVDADRVNQAILTAYKGLAGRANIPGFRRGKAPRRLVENYFGREYIYNQALEQLMPEAYSEAVKKVNIEPITQPEVELVQLEEGQPLVFKAKVEVKPEVELGEYKGLEATKENIEVTEADVDRFIENLRHRYAQLEDIDEEPLSAGDLAVVNYDGTINGEPFNGSHAEGSTFEVGGDGSFKDFTDKLVGMKIGEKKQIDITFPEDYFQKELAGKQAVFEVEVKEAKRRKLAPLDDEFAKDVSEFSTLQELREDITNKLRESAAKESDSRVKDQLLTKVVETSSVEPPPSMIENRTKGLLLDMEQRLYQQGLTLDDYLRLTKGSKEELEAGLKSQAEALVKRELVLEAIALKEDITVSDGELEQEIEAIAERNGWEAESLKAQLEGAQGLKFGLLNEKVKEFLVNNARIEVKQP